MAKDIFSAWDKEIDVEGLAADVKEAAENGSGNYKEVPHGNYEVSIEKIAKAQNEYDNLCKRKETILKSIEEQGKLTDDLQKRIEETFEINELEDLYLPYKKRRKTKAGNGHTQLSTF